ncbi:MAG: acyl-CoA dehydrogenase [Nocardioidaceae bacterium]
MTADRVSPPAPDPGLLTEYLEAPYADVTAGVRSELAKHADILDFQLEEPAVAFRERVLKTLLMMTESKQTGLSFPTRYGGGGDIGASIAAFQTLAYSDLSLLVKTGVQFGLFGGAILHLGSERHHDAHLADVISGRTLGCFAMSETGHGSNVQAVETTATYDADADEFVINTPTESGRKDYIGNAAAHGHFAVVFAQLVVDGEHHGVHALLVPIRDRKGTVLPGVKAEDCGPKLGLKGVDNGRLSFNGVRVPREALLNRYADVDADGTYTSPIENADRRFFTMLGTLVQGRVSVGGGALNASKVALTIAVRYANRRRQFGPPSSADEATLMTYRTHQRRLLPLLARSYALTAAQQDVLLLLHDSFSAAASPDQDRRVLESRAAGQKALATWHATEVIQICRGACGGAGYLSENRFAALKADTDVFTTFEGDNTVLLQLVAKGLLTEFKQGFNDLDPIGMVRFVATQAVESVVEKTAIRQLVERLRDAVPNREDDAGLLDLDYHQEVFRWREEHMRAGLARRLKRGIDEGSDPFEVFASCQDHVVSMARAHVERMVLGSFVTSVQRADEAIRPVLEQLCQLHALATIEADRAWFLEHGRLSSERSKAITAMVGRLCEQLAPVAEVLTDGFAIPEQLIRAPIARRP